jgi:drug/metabolite transporter (DMT)-like permease
VAAGRTAGFTIAALVAFAANSWLCRFALRQGAIDPATFTAVRLVSGALVLWPLARALEPRGARGGSWRTGVALFAYALAFSLAYISLDTGVGAFILFGTVQLTMIGAALRSGERLDVRQWLGLALALGGLAWLAAPGAAAPGAAPGTAMSRAAIPGGGAIGTVVGALFMTTAGIAWGVYSLLGRGRPHPFASTAGAFLRAAPLGLAALVVALRLGPAPRVTATGLVLAAASGAVTSGIGYVLWHAALRDLSASTAGIAQLSVPAFAAAGGVLLLGERPTPRLWLSGALILGGVALAVLRRPSSGAGTTRS